MYNQIVLSLGTLCAPELRLEQELVNADYLSMPLSRHARRCDHND